MSVVKENPVKWVSPDGSTVKMELMGLFVTVRIAVSLQLGRKRIFLYVEAMNPSTGATYSGQDVFPVVRRKAIKIATAIWRGRQEKIKKEGTTRSRDA